MASRMWSGARQQAGRPAVSTACGWTRRGNAAVATPVQRYAQAQYIMEDLGALKPPSPTAEVLFEEYGYKPAYRPNFMSHVEDDVTEDGEWHQAENLGRPNVDDEQVKAFVSQKFPRMQNEGGVSLVKQLDGERDLNFLCTTEAGGQYVVKVSNSFESRSNLDMQDRGMALAHAVSTASASSSAPPPSIQTQLTRAASSSASSTIAIMPPEATSGKTTHMVRVLNYLPGTMWSSLGGADFRSPDFLSSLGGAAAHLDVALHKFTHPALVDTTHVWDLACGPDTVSQFLQHIPLGPDFAIVHSFLGLHSSTVAPVKASLPKQAIHCDLNDNNVLVKQDKEYGSWTVDAVIDFGDMVHTERINNIAIACAYALLEPPSPAPAPALAPINPVQTVCDIVSGYQNTIVTSHASTGASAPEPLSQQELECLWSLTNLRLCTSVVMAARNKVLDPANAAYLSISERPAWDALRVLLRLRRGEHVLAGPQGLLR